MLHHRAVDHFREGRIFLAGDSAHIHSPAGGQGMNTGLQDAYNLCWKLALVLKKKAKLNLLETYNEERLPFAKWLIQFTDRGFRLMTSTNWFIRFARKFIALPVAGIVMSSSKMKLFAFKVVSQIWYNYRHKSLSESWTGQPLKFRSGDRLPYFKKVNIYANIKNASFHLLHIGNDAMDEAKRERIQNFFPFEIRIVEDNLDERWGRLGVEKALFILVRPDNYIAMIADEFEQNKISKYLGKYFNLPQGT